MRKRNSHRPTSFLPTRCELQRAIYIDFEGSGPRAGSGLIPRPALLGYLLDGPLCESHEVLVFRKGWQGVPLSLGSRFVPLAEGIRALIECAERERRRLIHFSVHEERVVKAFVKKLAPRFEAVAWNASPALKRRAKGLGLCTKGWGLERAREVFAPHMQRHSPSKRFAAAAIDRVDQAAREGVGRPKVFDRLVRYNADDCRVLKAACLGAAER